MAYDAQGNWKPEDDKVDTEVARITSQNTPLMQQAATQGLKMANRRGLMNSSIAVGASQGEVLKQAVPMASQNAAQTNAKNLSAQQFTQNRGIQDAELAATKQRQEADIAATAARQQTDIANQQQLQQRQIDRDKFLAQFDRDTQTTLKNLENEQQTKIAQMQLSGADRERAATMVANVTNAYAEMFRTIAQAEGIPAKTRDAYLQHTIEVQNNNLALVEQLFGINLDWAIPEV